MRYVFFAILSAAFAAGYPHLGAVTALTTNPDPQPAANAAQLYAKHCASCHGRDGRAKTIKGKLKHARDLSDREWQEKVSDERIFNSIMNGKGKMPGYAKKLSQDEIESLAGYIRGLKK